MERALKFWELFFFLEKFRVGSSPVSVKSFEKSVLLFFTFKFSFYIYKMNSAQQVTEKGQKFKVVLPTKTMRESFFKEDKVYICTRYAKYPGTVISDEVYVGDNWIAACFTQVIKE
jgi:hypothetical protein